MNNKIIINADDCGKSVVVNAAIEECINLGCITSTTIMANMDNLDGAKGLFDKYKNRISFGAHLDLSEAHPLTKSQILLDYGYFKETNNGVKMCGMDFRHTIFPKYVREELFKELDAQIQVLLDNGILISHIDSHRHIHFGYGILPVFVKVAEKYNISKIRIAKNFMKPSLHLYMGKIWKFELDRIISEEGRRFKTVDYFSSFLDYYNKNTKCAFVRDNASYELMVHPGHPHYLGEADLLKNSFKEFFKNDCLINYNQL